MNADEKQAFDFDAYLISGLGLGFAFHFDGPFAELVLGPFVFRFGYGIDDIDDS